MRPAVLLAQLNEIDLAVDASKARLAEIAQALKEPAALQQARTDLSAAQQEQARCRAMLAQREAEQRRVADHLAQAEKALYSGKTKASRELESAEKDVAQLRRQLAHADDALLEAMVAAETATADADARAAALAELSAGWDARVKSLRAELPQVKARLAEQQIRQVEARRTIADGQLVVYDSLRGRRAGKAVAALDGEECSVCGVAVPPTKLSQLREGDTLVYCDNCGRILWAE
jgi:predicted  nucleic acid-binding Zn-ribbon protein